MAEILAHFGHENENLLLPKGYLDLKDVLFMTRSIVVKVLGKDIVIKVMNEIVPSTPLDFVFPCLFYVY